MASRMFFCTSSMVRPAAMHPGRSGDSPPLHQPEFAVIYGTSYRYSAAAWRSSCFMFKLRIRRCK
jgi:hypothetical protein